MPKRTTTANISGPRRQTIFKLVLKSLGVAPAIAGSICGNRAPEAPSPCEKIKVPQHSKNECLVSLRTLTDPLPSQPSTRVVWVKGNSTVAASRVHARPKGFAAPCNVCPGATMCPLRDVSVLHNNCWANCRSNGSGPSSCRCLPEIRLTRCQPLVPSNGWLPSIHRMFICAQGQKAIHPIVPGKRRPSSTYLCMRHVQCSWRLSVTASSGAHQSSDGDCHQGIVV
jgi:hypothetical protein